MPVRRYQSRSTIVEAIQLTSDNLDDVLLFTGEQACTVPARESLDVFTTDGISRADPGDWIVRDSDAELDIYTFEEFTSSFEEAE